MAFTSLDNHQANSCRVTLNCGSSWTSTIRSPTFHPSTNEPSEFAKMCQLSIRNQAKLATGWSATGVAVVCAVLSACTEHAALPLDRGTLLKSDVRSLQHTGFPLPQLFGINDIGQLVVENNPDLVAARTQRGVAEAQVLQAGILPNPSLSGSYAFLLGGPATFSAITASIAQDVKSAIVRPAKRRAAEAAAQAVDASILWQEWQTIGKARLLVVDLIEGEKTRGVLAEAQRVVESRLAREQRALLQRDATLATVVPALTAAGDIRKQIDALERQQQTRGRDLDSLLGLSPEVAVPLDNRLDLPSIDPIVVKALLPTLPDRRPDLVALQFGYRSQEEKLRGAVLAQFPALSIGATGGRDTSDVRTLGPQITLDLPVFDRNQGNIAIEEATREKLHAEFSARITAAEGEVRGFLADQAVLAQQLPAIRAQLGRLQAAAANAAKALAAGNIDERGYVDLVTARLTKQQELIAVEQLIIEQQVAIATLIGAGMPRLMLPASPEQGQ
jgi:outer membrane protein TolC